MFGGSTGEAANFEPADSAPMFHRHLQGLHEMGKTQGGLVLVNVRQRNRP